MQRCNQIYNHPLYQAQLEKIKQNEINRRFCLHNLEHSLDTARIGYIMILEKHLPIKKELFYAAALLHDIGRYSGKPHNESGAQLAEKIMPDCGFDESEIKTVSEAIYGHRCEKDGTDFSSVLYAADKKSRLCFKCPAADECYWEQEKRNILLEL